MNTPPDGAIRALPGGGRQEYVDGEWVDLECTCEDGDGFDCPYRWPVTWRWDPS